MMAREEAVKISEEMPLIIQEISWSEKEMAWLDDVGERVVSVIQAPLS